VPLPPAYVVLLWPRPWHDATNDHYGLARPSRVTATATRHIPRGEERGNLRDCPKLIERAVLGMMHQPAVIAADDGGDEDILADTFDQNRDVGFPDSRCGRDGALAGGRGPALLRGAAESLRSRSGGDGGCRAQAGPADRCGDPANDGLHWRRGSQRDGGSDSRHVAGRQAQARQEKLAVLRITPVGGTRYDDGRHGPQPLHRLVRFTKPPHVCVASR
jgi:hypothetical protein